MPHFPFSSSASFAAQLDRNDPLADFRGRFLIPEPDLVYLDGNSLGRPPIQTIQRVNKLVVEGWGEGLIRGWNQDWFYAPQRVGEKIAKLVGAAPGQLIVSDTTSINLFKLVIAVLRQQTGRAKIVSDTLNFPSDLYILQGCIDLLENRHFLHLIPSQDGITIDLPALEAAIDENTALLTLSHAVFKSGFLYDMQAVTELAHRKGALVLWDLSHSAGVVPIQLDAWGADLAVGCTYKYLNGGPGSPAFLYLRRDWQDKLTQPIWGWFSQNKPFAFELDYTPAAGMNRFMVSSPGILSMLAMEASIDLYLEAGMQAVREKSILQTEYLIYLVDHFLVPQGFSLGTPRQMEQRGSHVSIRHADGYRINRALIEEMNLIPDFREPDNIRLGIAPLYTSYVEIWEGIDRIRRVVEERRYLKYSPDRLAVT